MFKQKCGKCGYSMSKRDILSGRGEEKRIPSCPKCGQLHKRSNGSVVSHLFIFLIPFLTISYIRMPSDIVKMGILVMWMIISVWLVPLLVYKYEVFEGDI